MMRVVVIFRSKLCLLQGIEKRNELMQVQMGYMRCGEVESEEYHWGTYYRGEGVLVQFTLRWSMQ
jgi:hypothetical protein